MPHRTQAARPLNALPLHTATTPHFKCSRSVKHLARATLSAPQSCTPVPDGGAKSVKVHLLPVLGPQFRPSNLLEGHGLLRATRRHRLCSRTYLVPQLRPPNERRISWPRRPRRLLLLVELLLGMYLCIGFRQVSLCPVRFSFALEVSVSYNFLTHRPWCPLIVPLLSN
jgi:hypothetical protein